MAGRRRLRSARCRRAVARRRTRWRTPIAAKRPRAARTVHARPQRLARHVLARAAGRSRNAAGAQSPTARSQPAMSRGCSTPAFSHGGAHAARRSARPKTFRIFKKQERLTFARVGVTDPVSLDDYLAHGGYRGLRRALAMAPAGDRAGGDRLRPARPRRRGVPDRHQVEDGARCSRPTQKYVTCNADEGDSGTFADRMLMEGDPFVLIEGMTIAGLAVGATQGYIYLRVEYPHAHRALRQAIAAAYERGYLGPDVLGSGQRVRPRGAARRRRLHLRRRDLDAREPRGQARRGPVAAAAAGGRRACSASRPSSTT